MARARPWPEPCACIARPLARAQGPAPTVHARELGGFRARTEAGCRRGPHRIAAVPASVGELLQRCLQTGLSWRAPWNRKQRPARRRAAARAVVFGSKEPMARCHWRCWKTQRQRRCGFCARMEAGYRHGGGLPPGPEAVALARLCPCRPMSGSCGFRGAMSWAGLCFGPGHVLGRAVSWGRAGGRAGAADSTPAHLHRHAVD